MIKKIYNVTYNEIFKQLKKKSFVAIVAVILLLAAIVPFIIKEVEFNSDYYGENLKNEITQYEKEINELSKSSKKVDKIKQEFYELQKEIATIKYENKLDQEDFRQEELVKYDNLSRRIILLDSLLKNVTEAEIEELRFDLIRNINEADSYMMLSNTEKIKERDKLIKERNEAKRIVLEKDYDAFLKNDLVVIDKTITEKNKVLAEAKKTLEKNVSNEEIKRLIYDTERELEYLADVREIKQFKVDTKLSFNKNDWKAKTVKNLEENMLEVKEEVKTEKEFLKNPYYNDREMSFDDYQELFFENKLKLKEEIKKDWYSLKNNIPQLEYIKDSRSTVYGTMDLFILLTIIVIIVVGAGIVSNEYSKGTVRLLLIRPISRFKILLAKLLSLIFIGTVLVTLSITILTISSGAAFGFDSFNIPIVSYYNGEAITIPFFKYMTTGIAISSVGVLFITAVVFSISTLAKNTALAVAVSIILYIGAFPITLVLAGGMGFIVTSFIPYMNMQIFRLIPSFAETVEYSSGVLLNYPYGIIQLSIISLVLIVITFIVFVKKDVRN